jgi:hypothetical protein
MVRLCEDGRHGEKRCGTLTYYIDTDEYERRGGDGWRLVGGGARVLCAHELAGPAPRPVVPPQQRLLAGWLPEKHAVEPDPGDLDAIAQLKARYFRTMDSRQFAEFAEVFSPDADFDIRGEHLTTAGWCGMVQSFLAGGLSLHHGHTPEIRMMSSHRARGIWTLTDYLEWPQETGRRAVRGYGHYEEEYRRDGPGWKIAYLRLSYLRFDELPGARTAESALRPFDVADWFDGWMMRPARAEDTARILQARASVDLDAATRGAVTHSHMPEVRFRGHDCARAIWSQVRHRHLDGSGDQYVDEYGYVMDEYVRQADGDWRLADSAWLASRRDHLMGDHYLGPAGREA